MKGTNVMDERDVMALKIYVMLNISFAELIVLVHKYSVGESNHKSVKYIIMNRKPMLFV